MGRTEDYKEYRDSGIEMHPGREKVEASRVTRPAPARLVFIDDIISHLSRFGSYISAEFK